MGGKRVAQTSLRRFRHDCTLFFDTLWVGDQKPLVFGDGLENEPILMLIGEAPGEQEAMEGKPFVGKAGRNLSAFLEALRLSRNEIYVTNVVKIRPTKMGASGRISNRPPTREEIELFLPWLMREIALVRPRALVTLGNVALHAFLSKGESIGKCHGKWRQAVVSPPQAAAMTLPLFTLYHPASIIYRKGLEEIYAQDVEALRNSLGLSPKQ